MMMGAVMVGGIITGKPPVNLSAGHAAGAPDQRIPGFVLPAESPLKSMKEVIEQLKKDPGSVKWGGGSRGSTEHIAAAMIAREVGADRPRSTTSPSVGAARRWPPSWRQRDGGRQRLHEFGEYIATKKMRPIGGHLATRLKGVRRADAEGTGASTSRSATGAASTARPASCRAAQGAHRAGRQGHQDQIWAQAVEANG